MVERGEGVGDEAVAAAARGLALTAPFAVLAQPVFKHARGDEPYPGSFEATALAFGFVVLVESLEFDVELLGQKNGIGGLSGADFEFDPPLVAAAVLAAGGVGENRGDVEIDRTAAVALADGGEGVGNFFFDDVFAKGAELELGAADVDEAGRGGGDEAHDITDDIASETARRGE